jgi:hypothetical protein
MPSFRDWQGKTLVKRKPERKNNLLPKIAWDRTCTFGVPMHPADRSSKSHFHNVNVFLHLYLTFTVFLMLQTSSQRYDNDGEE